MPSQLTVWLAAAWRNCCAVWFRFFAAVAHDCAELAIALGLPMRISNGSRRNDTAFSTQPTPAELIAPMGSPDMPMMSSATFVTPIAEPRASPLSMASAVLFMCVNRFCTCAVEPVVPVEPRDATIGVLTT